MVYQTFASRLFYSSFVENKFIWFPHPESQFLEGSGAITWFFHAIHSCWHSTGHREMAYQIVLSWIQVLLVYQKKLLSVELRTLFESLLSEISREQKEPEEGRCCWRSQMIDTISSHVAAGLLSVQGWGVVEKQCTEESLQEICQFTGEMGEEYLEIA